jgi:hypothetical protein
VAIYTHRAWDPAGAEYKYWRAEELDLDGTNYAGPPAFNTLENPVLVTRVLAASGVQYETEPTVPFTLNEFGGVD